MAGNRCGPKNLPNGFARFAPSPRSWAAASRRSRGGHQLGGKATLIQMSEREIFPIQHALDATVRMPGSKSLTNRALLVAALADGSTRLSNALFSDDSRYLANAFRALGLNLKMDEPHSEMTVTGLGGRIPAREAELYIGNAGTAARFLTAFLTLANGEYVVDGDARMRQQPKKDLVSALSQLVSHVETSTGSLHVKIVSSVLRDGPGRTQRIFPVQYHQASLMFPP